MLAQDLALIERSLRQAFRDKHVTELDILLERTNDCNDKG